MLTLAQPAGSSDLENINRIIAQKRRELEELEKQRAALIEQTDAHAYDRQVLVHLQQWKSVREIIVAVGDTGRPQKVRNALDSLSRAGAVLMVSDCRKAQREKMPNAKFYRSTSATVWHYMANIIFSEPVEFLELISATARAMKGKLGLVLDDALITQVLTAACNQQLLTYQDDPSGRRFYKAVVVDGGYIGILE